MSGDAGEESLQADESDEPRMEEWSRQLELTRPRPLPTI